MFLNRLLIRLVPGAGNSFLLYFSEDGIKGALNDVLAFSLVGGFGKFYFGWGVFGVGDRLGKGGVVFL